MSIAKKSPKKLVAHMPRSLRWIVRHAPSFVRRDSGGQKARLNARFYLEQAGINPGVVAVDAYLLGAKKARDTIDEYLEPVWKRLKEIVG